MLKLTNIKNIKKPLILLSKIKFYFKSRKSFAKFKALSKNNGNRFPVTWDNIFFIDGDNTNTTSFDSHYVYHPAWAARILSKTRPKLHVDISSTLNFCSIISAFITTEFYDFRPAQLNLDNLISKKADLTSLPFKDNSVASLSCMHTVEHVGLGRYGEPFNPNGDLEAINELKRVLSPNGDLLFVIPIGKPKIMFNAHRIYSFAQISEYFEGFELIDFSLVTDTGKFIKSADCELSNNQNYGCGCFWFKKNNL